MSSGFWAQGFGFGVKGLGVWAQGFGFGVKGLGFWAQGFGFGVKGLRLQTCHSRLCTTVFEDAF
jgi:hypothetical protein